MKDKMSLQCLYLLLSLCFAVEIVSGSSAVITVTSSLANVSPSPSSPGSSSSNQAVQTSRLPSLTPSSFSMEASQLASESAPASVQSTSTPSLSSVFILPPSPSISTTVSLTSESPSSPHSVSSPVGEVSPTKSVQGTASAAPTGQTSTSPDVGTKGKTIGVLEIAGFVILAILVVLVTAFAIYYCAFRRRMYPRNWSEPMVETSEPAAAAQTAGVEVGITHEAFVEESESPTNVAAPEPEVKVAEPEVKVAEPEAKDPEPEVKVSEPDVKTEGEENEEDSAL